MFWRISSWLWSVDSGLEQEHQQWFLWVPVSLAIGISIYFSLFHEPGWVICIASLVIGTGFVLIGYRSTIGLLVSGIIFWAALGFTLSKVRSSYMAAPVITGKAEAVTLIGWPEHISQQAKGGTKVTLLLHSMLKRGGKVFSRSKVPYRVRVVVRQPKAVIAIGQLIKVQAVLHPPPQPVWPGGFDYARKLWFSAIGGVGFAISVPENIHNTSEFDGTAPPFITRIQVYLERVREQVKETINRTIPGKFAPVAIALITGDRSGIDQTDLEALRDSGLAHILAISGLHMAIMAGTIYFIMRWLLAAIPSVALIYPIKKISAVLALAGGAVYLLISGGAVSTQRAYIMAAVMFIAIIVDRPGVTLRNVALAALIILFLRPESLLDVGFQMSFAAVAALVAIYEAVAKDRVRKKEEGQILRRPTIFPVRYLAGIASTTIIAGLAVAPIAAYHFHKISQFSLLGNLLAMPVIGLVIMPMALLSFLAIPLGLEYIPLAIMQWGLSILLEIANYVSSLPGAVRAVPQMPLLSLMLLTGGGLWLICWKGWWRYYGFFIIGMGLALMPTYLFPDVIIDRDGKVVAIKQENGVLAVPDRRGGEFSLQKWLQIYGDGRDVKDARSKKVFQCDRTGCIARVKGRVLSFVLHPSALYEDCKKADIVISRLYIKRSCGSAKVIIDRKQLKANGAHAIYIYKDRLRVETVQAYRYGRPWSGPVPSASISRP